jgi:hypothetical protein
VSSSTSSSDTVAGGSRGYYLRILLTILLGMAVALVLVRAFTATMGAGADSLLGRVLQAQAAIPDIAAEEKDLVMVFGSSMVHAGFSPREFDRDAAELGADVKSFNFGFGGLNPMFQDYLTRRIADGFEAEDRRLKLVLIEFNPFQTTITRRQGAVALEDSYIALLASPSELFQIFLEDPARGFRMMEIRYLRDGVSAEMITTFFWAEPFERPRESTALVEEEGVEERLDEVLEKLNEQFEKEYPDYDGAAWYYPWQGGGTIKAERSPETLANSEQYYELTQTDYQMDADRLQRVQSADILDLNFDPDLVEHFIAKVKNFQRISDHVEVVLLPKNTDWINNPPEALARQAAVLERIRQETGVPVRDFQEIESVENSMFSDTTHLNRYHGAVAFTRFLAEEYADRLK